MVVVSGHNDSDNLREAPCARLRGNSVLESLDGYIVWGCWELKRKLRFQLPAKNMRKRYVQSFGSRRISFRNLGGET